MTSLRSTLALLVLSAVTACGGGGGGGSATSSLPSSSASAISLAGSVSQGFPISGARVSLIDANGNKVDAGVTDSQGNYSVSDISGLKTPIIVSANGISGGRAITLYGMLSAKLSKSIANVTPMTDAILTQTAGSSPSLLVKNPSALATLDQAKAESTAAKVTIAVSNVMEQITPGSSVNFNPLTTAFTADGKTAADKVNDLVKVTSTISPTGVVTEVIDKSGNGGTVTITDSASSGKLPVVSQKLADINISMFSKTLDAMNAAFSSADNLRNGFGSGIDDNFLDGGLDKKGQMALFASRADTFAGARFSNPRIVSCNANAICQIEVAALGPNFRTRVSLIFRYEPSLGLFLLYGDQAKFRVDGESTATVWRDGATGATNISTWQAINIDGNNLGYQYARASFQFSGGTPDFVQSYRLDLSKCNPATVRAYNGIPLEGSTNCTTGRSYNSTDESIIKTINANIRRGGYVVRVEAWKTTSPIGQPDVVVMPLIDQLLTADKISLTGFPIVTVKQATADTLPYFFIENAADFSGKGSICITTQAYCQTSDPQPTTTIVDSTNLPVVPYKFEASLSDGWKPGQKAKAFFVHVLDKAGRDLTISGSFD